MSKSVSGQDVEDMLSSVRRLVSSELPRTRRASLPEGPGALVLTDAHRIAPSMLGHNSRPKSLEDRIAELEAAVSETADDWEPDGSEDQDQHRPDRIVYKASEEDRQSNRPRSLRLSEIALIETGPANEDEAGSSDALAAMATFRHDVDEADLPPVEEKNMLEEPAALADEDLSDVSEVALDEVRVDALETEEPVHTEAIVEAGNAGGAESAIEAPLNLSDEDLSDVSEVALDEVRVDALGTEEPAHTEAIVEAGNAGGAESAIEAPLNLSDEDLVSDIEPDEEAIDEIATDEAFEEALVEAVAASLPDAAIDEIERHEDGISSESVKELYGDPGTAQIDQASLHPLVAGLIREELQGELGERITRNVRKLVRQEIQRALTARELE